MSQTAIDVLKFCFLALLYLFLFRVVRVAVLEMRAPITSTAADTPAAPRKSRRSSRLRLLEPAEHHGEVYALDEETTVGRGGGCAIVLTGDEFVSTVHARLFRRGDDVYVEDLNSRNGTFVNGHQVETPTRIRRGDKVQFGRTVGEVVR